MVSQLLFVFHFHMKLHAYWHGLLTRTYRVSITRRGESIYWCLTIPFSDVIEEGFPEIVKGRTGNQ